jgi:hypothetical protein
MGHHTTTKQASLLLPLLDGLQQTQLACITQYWTKGIICH